MIEEFKDLILRRQEVSREWKDFTFQLKEDLWPDAFGRAKAEQGLNQRWLDAIRSAQSAADNPALRMDAIRRDMPVTQI